MKLIQLQFTIQFTHAVVNFTREEKNRHQNVDLIPIIWIDKNQATCSYPKKSQYKNLPKWVEESKPVLKSWMHLQPIEIIKRTSKYKISF